MGRREISQTLAKRPLLLVVGAVAASAAVLATVSTTPASATSCATARVHYERNRNAGAGLRELPWVATNRGADRLIGYLFYYGEFLADGRFNRSSGLVIPTNGGIPGVVSAKILWVPGEGSARLLTIRGQRLDAPGSFQHREAATGPGFPSIAEIPTEGCWRLTLQTGKLRGTIVVRAVDVAELACDPTPVRRNALPGVGGPWIAATPASAGIYGSDSVVVGEDDTAAIYVGGRGPDGAPTTVSWVAKQGFGTVFEIVGDRLDAPGSLHQRRRATGPSGRFPGVLRIPAEGCWLLTLRTGSAAGIVVFRAVPA
jgi:hypothetical protein